MHRPSLIALGILLSAGELASGQLPSDLSGLSGEQLYQASCANCHGADGEGLGQALLGFEEEMPDFTDCDFAAREPDGDWIAVAHEGGPVRGFSEMMPAFRGALTPDQLQMIMSHIRTLCTDENWPRGELNLPRGFVTEKAYPEDEWVVEGGVDLEGEGAFESAFVYERRFGARSQMEVKLEYGWRINPAAPAGTNDWVSGFGDVVLGVKHALHHSAESGTIFSLGGEVILPMGDETKGLGADGTGVEGFASFGQTLPSGAFVQAQTGLVGALWTDGDHRGFARLAVGKTLTQGDGWGRAWTPMLEIQVRRTFVDGTSATWDLIPQVQVALNTRQHVLGNIGFLIPATASDVRSVRLMAYVLLDWFDGGFFEGW
jgi:mono/diheme cytochrome c family protein